MQPSGNGNRYDMRVLSLWTAFATLTLSQSQAPLPSSNPPLASHVTPYTESITKPVPVPVLEAEPEAEPEYKRGPVIKPEEYEMANKFFRLPFDTLVGKYQPVVKESERCSHLGYLYLTEEGVYVRSTCSDTAPDGIGYTFGIWGIADGKYIETPNSLDINDTLPTSESIRVNKDTVFLANTRMIRRKQKYNMDDIPIIFSTFSSTNCLRQKINTAAFSQNGKYSITTCEESQPMAIENGVFAIDSVQKNNLTLTLYPETGVLYPATLQILGPNTIKIDDSLLLETSGRASKRPSYSI